MYGIPNGVRIGEQLHEYEQLHQQDWMGRVVNLEKIGQRLVTLRKSKGLSLRELSRRAILSASSLSAIEKDQSSPTLATLQRILQALNTNFVEFLGSPPPVQDQPVFRERNMTTIRDAHRFYTLLFPRRDNLKFEMLRERMMPGETDAEWETHNFDVGGVLLEGGPIRLEIEARGSWRVKKGDAFYVSAGEKHRAINEGAHPAVQIAIMCPPRY